MSLKNQVRATKKICFHEKSATMQGSMKTKKNLVAILFSLFLGVGSVAAQETFITVPDSLAGEDNQVRVSGLFAEEIIESELIRPDETSIKFPSKAGKSGRLVQDIHGLHVRSSGQYELKIIRAGHAESTFFHVYPGAVSAYLSTIEIENPSVEADGEAEARFRVILKDAFGNPIPEKKVMVISSRNEDQITTQNISDNTGTLSGKIKSRTPGVATLSAFVEEDGVVLFEKPNLVFYLSDTTLQNVGSGDQSYGEYLKAQLFEEESGEGLAYFSLENINTNPTVNETLTVKVVAKDLNGEIVKNYLGTVRFSSSDERAILPDDYAFTPEDGGEHTFFLALSFQTPGQQTLAVHDLDDFRRSGELPINVSLGADELLEVPSDTGLTLLTPKPGTLRSSRVTITGEAQDGITHVRLQDGEAILIGELEVDSQGNFVYQTAALEDGTHKFKAYDVDSDIESNEITIQIDKTPPADLTIDIPTDQTLEPGQEFEINVKANEPLSGVSVVFQDVLTQMIPSGDGFQVTLTAPLEGGEYPVSIVATDLLGNEGEEPEAGIITVATEVVGEIPVESDQVAPTGVTNVSAQSGDGKITLFWSPAKDNAGIANYRVEFTSVGLDEETPSELTFNQFNLTPDDRTQWYVDELGDDQRYYFRVIAIDQDGNESPASEMIESVTTGAQEFMLSSAPELERSGAGISIAAILIALIGGIGVMMFSRKIS